MSDNKHKIIIAIDGFSSCGKSTFAKAIARELGYIFIDTGAMYRAVTLYALEHGAIRSGIVDEDAVVRLLDQIAITFRFNPERGASDIYVNGDLVEGKIRTIEVSNCVSRVSAIAAVRRKLVAMQQEMGRRRGVVMDGDKAEHLLEAIPVMGSYCDVIGVRSFARFHDKAEDYEERVLEQFIRYSGRPVFSIGFAFRSSISASSNTFSNSSFTPKPFLAEISCD